MNLVVLTFGNLFKKMEPRYKARADIAVESWVSKFRSCPSHSAIYPTYPYLTASTKLKYLSIIGR